MRSLFVVIPALALAAACGDPFDLQATIPNRPDTVSLYALSGTPVTQPSGYIIPLRSAIRTDRAFDGFDFAFDIDTAGRAVLLPTGALGLRRASGIRSDTVAFESITVAPGGGYELDSAVIVDSNAVVIIHSRPQGCSFSISTSFVLYAKLHVLAIDTTSGPDGRRIDFVILSNVNCGFRGLEEGLPTR